MKPWRVSALVLMLALSRVAFGAEITAGPMAGYRDARSTLIWLQAGGTASARIEYWPARERGARRSSAPVLLNAKDDFTAQVALHGLTPDTEYEYRVLLDGRESRAAGVRTFRTERLWQWQRHAFLPAKGHVPADFRIAFGSCAYFNDPPFDRSNIPGGPYGGDYGIYDRIAERKPDVMLWLGDNTYLREADYGHPAGIAERYRIDRARSELRRLLATGNHYAIWDDHDFGPDDANSSFAYKAEALATFRRYWPNGGAGMPDVPGIFRAVSINDVDVFLLDGRYHRDADAGYPARGKRMLGEGQMRWLKNALLASRASFRIIVSGSQVLNAAPSHVEGWSHFPEERGAFLDWLADNRIPGVLFLSGDRHHSVLTRLNRQNAYPLFDFTCSPLTAGAHKPAAGEGEGSAEPGTLVVKRNFCTIDVDGAWGERRLVLRAFDAAGGELWTRELHSRELRYP